MPVIGESAPTDRKAAQFDIIRQSNPFDAELGITHGSRARMTF